jgi:hypothetical protein
LSPYSEITVAIVTAIAPSQYPRPAAVPIAAVTHSAAAVVNPLTFTP